MVALIAKWFIGALAFLFTASIVPGIEVQSFYTALILAFVWGALNLIFRPLLLLLALPITILTLGLFTFVVSGFLFWFLGTIVKGFHVENIFVATLGAFLVSVISWVGSKIFSRKIIS